MPQLTRQRFTYRYEGGQILCIPTEEYLFALDHTFSRLEIERFTKRKLAPEQIVATAHNRGWPWFNVEDLSLLRYVFDELPVSDSQKLRQLSR